METFGREIGFKSLYFSWRRFVKYYVSARYTVPIIEPISWMHVCGGKNCSHRGRLQSDVKNR